MSKSDQSYRERIITFGLYLGYGEAGKALKQRILDHCKKLDVKPSAWIRDLIEKSLPKTPDNQ